MLKIFKTLKKLFKTIRKKDHSLKMQGELYVKFIPRDGSVVIDKGLIASKCVTDAGVAYLVDSFQSSTGSPMDAFYYHGSGTSTGAESSTETALGTEIETRTTGTQIEGAAANIYKTVSTHTYTSTGAAITEHGLFSSSTGPTMWDRSLFAAINVSSGDSIEFTYELTCTAGG